METEAQNMLLFDLQAMKKGLKEERCDPRPILEKIQSHRGYGHEVKFKIYVEVFTSKELR